MALKNPIHEKISVTACNSFFIYTIGTTGGYKKVYYHLPGDDPDVVTIDIMEDVAKMIFVALTEMAKDTTLTFQ